jgi:hypothetical protein
MLESIHEDMLREVLANRFSPRALEIIIAANVKQDSWRWQIGHDEIHFDNNAIDAGNRYINEQRGYILAALLSPGVLSAWIAFGRLLHTAQDFYSHTNYVSLWVDANPHLTPREIDPLQKDLIESSGLHSGKLYFPLEILYFIPPLRKFSLSILPRDSHAWMNLDSPQRGPRFEYARAAAVKRTQHEFEVLEKILIPEMFAKFCDL